MKHYYIFFDEVNSNIEYIIGTNKKDNFYIIDKAKPTDLWFHLDEYPSGHVIANIPEDVTDKKILKSIAKQGAILCKNNSKYSSIKNLKIVYTTINNIEKTDIIGEVTISNPKYIII
jgi:predicted ribosome quality control (RQC) complex YloA/Tae2 family protein